MSGERLDVLRRMVENRPDDPRLHFGLAVELLNSGNTREGAAALRRYLDLSEDEYMDVIRRKTAVLMESACHVGALVAKGASAEVDALKRYGHRIGMAFQMADDLLDYTSDTTGLGKPVGADLREGKLTLPVIAALQAADPEERKRMAAIIQNPAFTLEDFEALKTMLERHGGLAYTRDKARAHVRTAKEALGFFTPSPTTEILNDLADFTLQRRA